MPVFDDERSVPNWAAPADRQPQFMRIEEKAMGKDLKEAQARAEAKFQKQQKAAEEGATVKAEREAQARAVDANTARLDPFGSPKRPPIRKLRPGPSQQRLRAKANPAQRRRNAHPDRTAMPGWVAR